MDRCTFCYLDKTKIYNTILEETDNFIVVPTLGSLVDGYILIVSKKHLYNMNELSKKEKQEYFNLIDKYRNLFNKIYKKYPIVFEHGTSKNIINESASSVVHAHTHIVNHNYKYENDILTKLNFKTNIINKDKNYIFYISPINKKYITYNFEPVSQLMRIMIAKDLGFENKYNWRKEPFLENIISTIDNIKKSI